MALISIAHPDYRADLLKKAIEYGYVVPELADVEGKLFVYPHELVTTMVLLYLIMGKDLAKIVYKNAKQSTSQCLHKIDMWQYMKSCQEKITVRATELDRLRTASPPGNFLCSI